MRINKLLCWHIYLQAEKPVDMGVLNSNFEKLLEQEYFLMYKKTFPNADYENMWMAYDAIVELWSKVGHTVAARCGYLYPDKTQKEMLDFIQRLRVSKRVSIC